MSDFTDIAVVIDGAVGSIVLNRPEANNSLRPQTLGEICDALDQLNGDAAVRVIVLRAEGKHFCAGADFGFLDDLTRMAAADIKAQIYSRFQGAAKRLYHSPKPTIAAIQGANVTVGCELALACDFRIMAEGSFLQESWIKLGIMPPLGGLFLLPRIVGLGRASEMVLQGRPVKAEEAMRLALATEVVPLDDLSTRTETLALELAGAAPLAYAAVKEALHRGLETTMETEWSANVNAQSLLIGSEDFREGLEAVKGRRKAEFKGR
ncbi:MAG: enoyl-CoA hydratase/isomerase family protein [Brevundimonas sp.]|nr:enoyl-CoA hydratase/isomerase family protein [Brevundimonas sp.]